MNPWHRLPRWVKVSGIVIVVLLLLVVGWQALGSIGHRPGPPPGGHQPAGASAPGCEAQPIDHDGGSGATLTCTEVNGAGETTQRFTCQKPQFIGLQVDRDLEAGTFTVTVKDAAGAMAFTETYSGKGSDSGNLQGQDGSWEITAKRSAGFAGGFSAQVFCGQH